MQQGNKNTRCENKPTPKTPGSLLLFLLLHSLTRSRGGGGGPGGSLTRIPQDGTGIRDVEDASTSRGHVVHDPGSLLKGQQARLGGGSHGVEAPGAPTALQRLRPLHDVGDGGIVGASPFEHHRSSVHILEDEDAGLAVFVQEVVGAAPGPIGHVSDRSSSLDHRLAEFGHAELEVVAGHVETAVVEAHLV
ncbi:hypothetical protein N7493_010620 [Penicillium malachiteum]|uniref:Secreted protein n=1 Tax=Penicillium malachiteum TaxID=1324776 RepID=A0AAD6HD34_9EURO|nr:hypothetical protein N7493_010620 [Penicillium malachiteum]